MDNTQFPFLFFLSGMMKFLGFILLVTGIYFGLYQGIIEPLLPKHGFSGGDAMELGGGLAALFFGVVSMLISELVKVMLAIELNTRNGQQEELKTQQTDEGAVTEAI